MHSLGQSINQIFKNQQNLSSHIVYLSLNLNYVYFFLVLGHSGTGFKSLSVEPRDYDLFCLGRTWIPDFNR